MPSRKRRCSKLTGDRVLSYCTLRWLSIPALIGFLALLPQQPYRLAFNQSVSEQTGFWLIDHGNLAPKRGEFVEFSYQFGTDVPGSNPFDAVTDVRNGADLLKSVIGIPGDKLYSHDGAYWLITPKGERIDLGQAQVKTPSGKIIPMRQHWDGYTIPANHYFMSSTRVKQSFDSRYFGLVPADRMIGTAKLLMAIDLEDSTTTKESTHAH